MSVAVFIEIFMLVNRLRMRLIKTNTCYKIKQRNHVFVEFALFQYGATFMLDPIHVYPMFKPYWRDDSCYIVAKSSKNLPII